MYILGSQTKDGTAPFMESWDNSFSDLFNRELWKAILLGSQNYYLYIWKTLDDGSKNLRSSFYAHRYAEKSKKFSAVFIPENEEEFFEQLNCAEKTEDLFETFSLCVSSPVASMMGKKYDFLIMNHIFTSLDGLRDFYIACRDFDKSYPTHVFLKEWKANHSDFY